MNRLRRLLRQGHTACVPSRLPFAIALLSLAYLPGVVAAQSDNLRVQDFAWLEGTWEGEMDVGDGVAVAEVQYLAPRGGAIVGSFRLTKDGAVLVVELFTIVEVDGVVEMRLRHFSDRLRPWEAGDPIVLALEAMRDGAFTFRNHVNDSPRWSYLKPLDGDRFLARSEIYADDGTLSEIRIEYRRVD